MSVDNRCFCMDEKPEGRKNKNFVQMNRDNMPALRLINRKNPYAHELFTFLCEQMDRYNCISCSQKVLQEVMQCSRTTIYRAIKDLKDENLMIVMKQGSAQVFVLNPEVVWTTWESNKKYCEFQGKILLAKDENKRIGDLLGKFKSLKLKSQPPRKNNGTM